MKESEYFPERRLPELFCGLYRTRFDFPAEYPASSSPQAWSAGSILLFLRVMLGISVGVPEKRIEIRPMLPPPAKIIDVENFPAAGGVLSLHLEKRKGQVDVHCENKPEGFELVIG